MTALPLGLTRPLYVGEDAVVRLAQLGLDAPRLHAAIRQGHEAKERCTPFHPRQSPGQAMWADTVAGLRAGYVPRQLGWEPGSTNNYETCYNAELGVSISVVGGDSQTGVTFGKDPAVRRRRGPVTSRRVRRNYVQMSFDIFEAEVYSDSDEDCDTWFLLLHATADSIRAELSLPIGLTPQGVVNEWAERIIVPPLEVVGGVTPIEADDDTPGPLVSRKG